MGESSDGEGDLEERQSERTSWFQRFDAEERRRVLDALFPERRGVGGLRFSLLQALSIAIAVMGLSLDSPAVVIGAMLIAPLMTPVMALSAALAMAWPRRLGRAFLTVVAASVGSVGLAYALAALLPTSDLTEELVSRTSPDVRDLVVALAAGAAGAYATARESVSSALPGVAVAVALIPPVAAVGVLLESGRSDLAEGAALLYLTNLVAIVVSGVVVLVLSGFVPQRRLVRVGPQFVGATMVSVAALVVLGIPLTQASLAAADRAHEARAVTREVQGWLSGTELEMTAVEVDGSHVVIDLAGPQTPHDADTLAAALEDELGEDVRVELRWSQRIVRQNGVLAPDEPPEAIDEAAWRQVVDEWLAGTDLEVVAVRLEGQSAVTDVAGPSPPPSVRRLAGLTESRLGRGLDVRVRWIERHHFEASPGTERTQERTERARAVVLAWLADRDDGLDVERIRIAEDEIVVDLAGPDAPRDVTDLVEMLEDELPDHDVTVRFSQRVRLHPPTTGVDGSTSTG